MIKNIQTMAIIGAQWGDEGKGKITDTFAKDFDYVVRFQGGNNAGHTIFVENKKTVLHLLPSGVLHPHILSIMGSGMVINPSALIEEMKAFSLTPNQLRISEDAWVLTDFHQLLDKLREASVSKENAIGTTGKGIGPCYEDRASRVGMKIKELWDLPSLTLKLDKLAKEKICLFNNLYQDSIQSLELKIPSVEECAKKLYEHGQVLREFCGDTSKLLWDGLEGRNKKRILFEGAQGVLLDADSGMYPYVTSSTTLAHGISMGCGIPLSKVDMVLGVSKVYTTRVGNGPFPTELFNDLGDRLQDLGHERGATTGRKRRCGLLDLPMLRYAMRVSSLTHIALTKFDVLVAAGANQICVGYDYNGVVYDEYWPMMDLNAVRPVLSAIPDRALSHYKEFRVYIESLLGKAPGRVPMITFGVNRDDFYFE